jgi:arylsulfate sulfotransferase
MRIFIKIFSIMKRTLIILFFGVLLVYSTGCKKESDDSGIEISLAEILGNNRGFHITENPNGIAPLTAIASFESTNPLNIEIKINGELPITYQFPNTSTGMDIPIIGLYPDTTNSVEIKLINSEKQYCITNLLISTDSLPDFFPDIQIEQNIEILTQNMTLCSYLYNDNGVYKSFPFIFDSNGDIRWYLDLRELNQAVNPCKILSNAYISMGFENYFREYDFLGEIKNELNLSGYTFHNDVIELPNNNLACPVSKPGSHIISSSGEVLSTTDHLVEIDRNSGTIIQEWDLREVLDVDREEFNNEPGDWIQLNSLTYNRNDDTYILSGKYQGVFKIDRNNDLFWILAPHQNWGESGWDGNGIFQTEDFLLTAVDENESEFIETVQNGTIGDENFNWAWGQNSVSILSNGNLLMFDSGMNRYFTDNPSFSRAVEYRINENNHTLTQVWEYGTELGTSAFSPEVGSVIVIDENNRLITFGLMDDNGEMSARIIKINYPDNQELFNVKITFKSPTKELSDVILRAENVNLYENYD